MAAIGPRGFGQLARTAGRRTTGRGVAGRGKMSRRVTRLPTTRAFASSSAAPSSSSSPTGTAAVIDLSGRVGQVYADSPGREFVREAMRDARLEQAASGQKTIGADVPVTGSGSSRVMESDLEEAGAVALTEAESAIFEVFNAGILVDRHGVEHTVINITGLSKAEFGGEAVTVGGDDATASIAIDREVGRGSERQIYIANLSITTEDGPVDIPVAISVQDVGIPQTKSVFQIVTGFFRAPEEESPGKIDEKKLAGVYREYQSQLAIGEHPNVDTVRSMGPGILIENKVVNIAELGTGDMSNALTGDMSFPKLLDLLGQGADGLAHVHSKGFCHNDLKPENLLIYKDVDGSQHVKLADFGHTRPEGSKADQLLGTPAFVQTFAGQTVGKHTDIRGFAQTCLDFFHFDLVDRENTDQLQFFIKVNKYFTEIEQGNQSPSASEMGEQLRQFAEEAADMGFVELGDTNLKEKIRSEEQKRTNF